MTATRNRGRSGALLATVALAISVGTAQVSLAQTQETIVIRSGQSGGSPGVPGQLDDCLQVIQVSQYSSQTFYPVFTSPSQGPAKIVKNDASGLDPAAFSDPQARWVNHEIDVPTQLGYPPNCVLYACDFWVETGCEQSSAKIEFCWAVDDRLYGIYLNGQKLPGLSGGSLGVESCGTASLWPGDLAPGWNTLYVYQEDTNAHQSAILFSATITIDRTCSSDISGRLFDDQNTNGIAESGEPGLAGWSVALTTPQGDVLRTTTTDGSGAYQFEVAPCAEYRIEAELPSCWYLTSPAVELASGQCISTQHDLGLAQAPVGPALVEQQQAEDTGSIGIGAALAQEFVAQSSTYVGIELLMGNHTSGPAFPPNGPITIEVTEDDLAGNLVASATVTPGIPQGSGSQQWVHLPIALAGLTPGRTYVMGITFTPSTSFWHGYTWAFHHPGLEGDPNPNPAYPDGIATIDGLSYPGGDFAFRLQIPGPCAPPGVQFYGCGENPAGSLTWLSGTPSIGSTLTFGIDNPVGTQAPGSFPYLLVSNLPDPNAPCGTPIAGFGMVAPGHIGAVLVQIPAPLVIFGTPWMGPGIPAPMSVMIPNNPALVGLDVYAQGVLGDPSFFALPRYGLTEAAQFTIGF